MNKEELIKRLKDEGFTHVYEWSDDSGVEYPVHAHKGAVSLYIVDGDLTFWFGEEERHVSRGERFDVPIGAEHTAKVGENGCVFVVGEMIEGDS